MVKALIFTDEQEIVAGKQEFLPGVPNTIAMMVSRRIFRIKMIKEKKKNEF